VKVTVSVASAGSTPLGSVGVIVSDCGPAE
jgi:hypothetical protein